VSDKDTFPWLEVLLLVALAGVILMHGLLICDLRARVGRIETREVQHERE
jgi:hypothetical protein